MATASVGSSTWYRFRPGIGWFEHLWKSVVMQSHADMRAPLRHVLPVGGIAMDVGAHGGQLTRLLASMVGPSGLIVAVEPSGYARSILGPALFLRRVRNVIVIACALGASNGLLVLRTPLKRLGAMGWGLANLSAADQQQRQSVAEPVPVLTLDDLVQGLELTRLDFIKVDIEGHEAAFVAGGKATLARFRPALLLEMSASRMAKAGASPAALWATLADEFRYFPYELHAGALKPVTEIPKSSPNVLWLPAPLP